VQVEAPNLEGETHNDHVQNPNNQSNVAATAEPIEAEVAEHPPVVATRFERDPGKRVQYWNCQLINKMKLGDFIF